MNFPLCVHLHISSKEHTEQLLVQLRTQFSRKLCEVPADCLLIAGFTSTA